MVLLSLFCTLAAVSVVLILGEDNLQFRDRSLSIKGGKCDRWLQVVSEDRCPMAYSLVLKGDRSPYYDICRDYALGEVSVDEVVTMYISTNQGEELQCDNAHACVGCPLLAGLLKSCPLLEDDHLGAAGASSGAGKRKRRSITGETTNAKMEDGVDDVKRKKCPALVECEGDCHEDRVLKKCPHGYDSTSSGAGETKAKKEDGVDVVKSKKCPAIVECEGNCHEDTVHTKCPHGYDSATSGAGKRKRRPTTGETTKAEKCPVMVECEGDCYEGLVHANCPHGYDLE